MVICRWLILVSVTTLLIAVFPVLAQPFEAQTRTVDKSICTPTSCFGLDYESVAYVYYSGIFFTEAQIKEEEIQWQEKHASKWGLKTAEGETATRKDEFFNSDYDLCCPTRPSRAWKTHLMNISGTTRAIVQMDHLDQYQWVPDAMCVEGGSCRGECQIENIAVTLLVYKMGSSSGGTELPCHWWCPWLCPGCYVPQSWPFEFDTFEVPGYCSCKKQ